MDVFDKLRLDKFMVGTEVTISGIVLNTPGVRDTVVFLPEHSKETQMLSHEGFSNEEFQQLLTQLDNQERQVGSPVSLEKVILRKSQRNVETGVSWEVFRRDGYRCMYCNANDVPLTVDHVVTWESMGDSVVGNLLSCCKKCNKTRGNLSFTEWLSTPFLESRILRFSKPAAQMAWLGEFYTFAVNIPLRKTQRSR